MNEVEFKNYLFNKNIPKKIQSDYTSRLKLVEKELHIDLDNEYEKDECVYLLSLFRKKGLNRDMEKYDTEKLPIGQYQLSTFRLCIKKYIEFRYRKRNG